MQDDPAGSHRTQPELAMKGQEWTWKEVAIVVGFVFATIGVGIITLWILWNSPALLP
jgi:hypothetical protein